jgi:hypothetical protein
MNYKMNIRKAEDLAPESFVLTPQHPTGILLAREIVEVEALDWGNHIEITTDDQLKHLVKAGDKVLVMSFGNGKE